MVPETRTPEVRWREELRNRRATASAAVSDESFWASLPRPLYVFGTLLTLDFIGVFVFAFVEPQMVSISTMSWAGLPSSSVLSSALTGWRWSLAK